MKNYVYAFVFLMTLSFLSCNENSTNSNKENNDSNSPKIDDANDDEISLNNTFTLPKELVYVKEKEGFLYDSFYPIGWSEDGNFAYISEPADESSGLYFFEFYIIDIVNNKEVWTWKPEESEEGNLKSVWDANYKLFAQRLNEYKISQTIDFKLEPTKLSYKSNDYELNMETKLETDEGFGLDIVKGIKLTMQSPQLGSKPLFEQRIDTRDYILSAYVPGLLISPKLDRAIVICQKERIGAGGPPNMVFFELIGTNMSTGFSKEDIN